MEDEVTAEAALEAPVCHHAKATEATPLVWVGGAAPPSAQWVRRVAAHVGGEPETEPESGAAPGAFGARQRGWLTRLTWVPSSARERRLLRSSSFFDRARLAALAARMPEEAVRVPARSDCIVDGITPVGEVMFYALFEGPEPWTPVALIPVAPPFGGLTRPLLLGHVEARLREWAAALRGSDLDETAQELLRSAMSVVEGDMR